jgi:hypothetical protein
MLELVALKPKGYRVATISLAGNQRLSLETVAESVPALADGDVLGSTGG